MLGVDLSKQQQSSDWGADELSDAQVAYAATDVLHLHALKEKLDAMLARENRADLAAACFRFLPDRVRLDLAGWAAEDIFSHLCVSYCIRMSVFVGVPVAAQEPYSRVRLRCGA